MEIVFFFFVCLFGFVLFLHSNPARCVAQGKWVLARAALVRAANILAYHEEPFLLGTGYLVDGLIYAFAGHHAKAVRLCSQVTSWHGRACVWPWGARLRLV
jgi:hypothetical protein